MPSTCPSTSKSTSIPGLNCIVRTEKDIRLFILDELLDKSSDLQALYRSLKGVVEESKKPIVLNGDELAA